MLERHKLLMGRTQDRAGQNNGSIGVFWRSFNGIIGHIRYMFRGLKITHNHEHSSLYCGDSLVSVRYLNISPLPQIGTDTRGTVGGLSGSYGTPPRASRLGTCTAEQCRQAGRRTVQRRRVVQKVRKQLRLLAP